MSERCWSSPVLSPSFSVCTPDLSSIDSSRLFIGVSSAIADVPAALEFSRPAADQSQRQIGVRVPIAVGDAAAVEDHRVIEQRAVAVRSRFHALDQISELIHVMRVDLDGLGDLDRIVLVMRAVVMAVGNADLAIAAIAALAGQHERNHARQIGLVGDHHQVHHQPRMVDELFGSGHGKIR